MDICKWGIISSLDNIPVGLEQHPHAKQERWNKIMQYSYQQIICLF